MERASIQATARAAATASAPSVCRATASPFWSCRKAASASSTELVLQGDQLGERRIRTLRRRG
jgi:hypothetical protein